MSDYVYNYSSGDEELYVDTDDTVTFDSDTSVHIRGIQQVADYRTVVVFDNYRALNLYGRVGEVIVDGKTVIKNDPISVDTSEISTDDTIEDFYTTTGGTVDLSNIGLTSDRIRGIQQVADYRTVVVYDNYKALNIYGRPASVVDGDVTLLTNASIPSGDWGDSSTEGFTTKYGNTVLFLSENDTIDLSYVDPFEVLGINIEEDQSLYVFDDFSSLRVYGNPSEVVIGDDTFSIDYNRKTLTMQETSTTTEEV